MALLEGFEVVQIGDGLAAAVCGRLLADIGAKVTCIDADSSTHLAEYLNLNRFRWPGQPSGKVAATTCRRGPK
jgi:crotonobetainyl-CoA:carnitine CoA-transferase CaiB-like acyl-CoA transferase